MKGRGLKILTSEQMLERLPIALAQVKAGSTYKNLLNEIYEIISSFYWGERITKNVWNNMMSSINL